MKSLPISPADEQVNRVAPSINIPATLLELTSTTSTSGITSHNSDASILNYPPQLPESTNIADCTNSNIIMAAAPAQHESITIPSSQLGPTSSPPGTNLSHEHTPTQPDSCSIDFTPNKVSECNANLTPRSSGASTPIARPSVQFARCNLGDDSDGFGFSYNSVNCDFTDKDRKPHFFSKLKSLTSPMAHASEKSWSSWGVSESFLVDSSNRGGISNRHPTSIKSTASVSNLRNVENLAEDADGEESLSDTIPPDQKLNKGKARCTSEMHIDPLDSSRKLFNRETAGSSTRNIARPSVFRRATAAELSEQHRLGLSEDEGREQLARQHKNRRGSTWMHGPTHTFSFHRDSVVGLNGGEFGRISGNLRRFTARSMSQNVDEAHFWRRNTASYRWRQIKAGLKIFGAKKRSEDRVDTAKSTELIAELLAGTPAALFLASMFQRDEKGHRRIPVLLEQLMLRITDSEKIENKHGDRHVNFRIVLEYGCGLIRMKWVIHRTLRDIANLHLKYKFQSGTEKYIQLKSDDSTRNKLPRFPKSALPYLRGVRGLADDDDDEDDEHLGGDVTDGEISGTGDKGRSNEGSASVRGIVAQGSRRQPYVERQRKRLEQYLQQMISHFMFRPDSNRLCKFLELSALGVRLAAEGGYHGKEGFMIIQSGKGLDFRRSWSIRLFKDRHRPKWFLVRHSYLVCVDSPEEINIYDVFLVDSEFSIEDKKDWQKRRDKAQEFARRAKETAYAGHHQLRLQNSERRMKFLARNERQLHQFEESINQMLRLTGWSRVNRFGSFAPVRRNVFAQWLVDGRDYMWNVSRAISMAKDAIYIHDWWLSPELYMRRPAAISQKWRLDRLLQRKAQEGVKIFVIVYRNINTAIPIDSEYSKFSLLDLHPNIFVQRSPNQFRQNTFFWAHHEKICIVDHLVAFCGGVDLCFGRWDTPGHTLNDDKPTGFELTDLPKDSDHCQLWPGKDYSNPRVQDFYALDKPYEEMYDRTKVPRMPWHDVGMQIVGQPARDMTRYFVQRWNYILRQRKPSRPTPFLLPPPDFDDGELEYLGLNGTCEIQLLRSSCDWSMGIRKTESSIEKAYIKLIEASDHFVYIENQFFISSCEVEGTTIENQIGDALVERIKRAHTHGEYWRAYIIIPLMPGFQNTVDVAEGSSVRLIMQCQYRSICRGETSIFGRLREVGIEPDDYIQFYALRKWGTIGLNKTLVTEQLYVHAKCMIVDDRMAIIGSANINERSMRGNRDSEIAVIVRDRDMVPSMMAGEPYDVGKFPHSLRMRLMREHLGIEVDELMERQLREERVREKHNVKDTDSDGDFGTDGTSITSVSTDILAVDELAKRRNRLQDELFGDFGNLDEQAVELDVKSDPGTDRWFGTEEGNGDDDEVKGEEERNHHGKGKSRNLFYATSSLTLYDDVKVWRGNKKGTGGKVGSTREMERMKGMDNNDTDKGGKMDQHQEMGNEKARARCEAERVCVGGVEGRRANCGETKGVGQRQGQGQGQGQGSGDACPSMEALADIIATLKRPCVTENCMQDPVADEFFTNIWSAVAQDNTNIFRYVFRCMPDDDVRTWKEYREYVTFGEKFLASQGEEAMTVCDGKKPATPDAVKDNDGVVAHKQHDESVRQDLRITNGWPIKSGCKEDGEIRLGKVETEESMGFGLVENAASNGINRIKEGSNGGKKNEDNLGSGEKLMQSNSNTRDYTNVNTAEVGKAELKLTSTPMNKKRRKPNGKGHRGINSVMDNVMLTKKHAEALLQLVQGHLVIWPYNWLEKEENKGGWLYAVDQIAPLELYT